MSAPPGVVDPNPPSNGYGDGYVIYLTNSQAGPRYTLRCQSQNADPVWVYEAFD